MAPSVAKRHLMVAVARNLTTIMRVLFGIGCPKALQRLRELLATYLHSLRPRNNGEESNPDALGCAPRRGALVVQRGVIATSSFTKTSLSTDY